MKTRGIVIVLCLFLFSSCIVKSLQPFYTKSSEQFDVVLVGKWADNKKGEWQIASFKKEWEKENKDETKISKEDKEAFERYKNSYYVTYTKKENEASFIAMPFKVNEHLFIDFTPIDYESDDLNKLVGQHLLKTHSTAYAQKNEDNTITLKWLSEKAIGSLFEENKLRLKHEKIGLAEDLVLTATSEELYNFLKKFMASDFEDKWDNDDIYTLKPDNAKP